MYLILKAIIYASWVHRKQFRRGTLIPYVFHPLEVGLMLYWCGFDKEMIIAGILHDTLEDTDAKPFTVQKHFGEKVLLLVKCLSNNYSDIRRLAMKWDTYVFNDAKIIKTCDVMANINSKLRKSGYVNPKTSIKYYKFIYARRAELEQAVYEFKRFEYIRLFHMVKTACEKIDNLNKLKQ